MTRSPRASVGGAESSFTLVEILVSVTILSGLLIALFSFLLQVNKVWQHGLSGIERRQNARAFLDFMAVDLQFATAGAPLSGTNAAVRATWSGMTNNLSAHQFLINPAGNSALKSMSAQALFWQAPIATVTTYGNEAEVGYSVAWTEPSPTGPSPAILRRFFQNPPDPNNPGMANFYSNPTAWISQTLLDSVSPADAAHQFQGLFAEDVYALWVRALDPYGKAIVTTAGGQPYTSYAYDSRQGYTDSQGVIHPPPALPAMLELALVGADARTSRMLLHSYPAGSYATTPANFENDITNYVAAFPAPVRNALHVYSTRIALNNSH